MNLRRGEGRIWEPCTSYCPAGWQTAPRREAWEGNATPSSRVIPCSHVLMDRLHQYLVLNAREICHAQPSIPKLLIPCPGVQGRQVEEELGA